MAMITDPNRAAFQTTMSTQDPSKLARKYRSYADQQKVTELYKMALNKGGFNPSELKADYIRLIESEIGVQAVAYEFADMTNLKATAGIMVATNNGQPAAL